METADELLTHAMLANDYPEIRPSELWSLFQSQEKCFEMAKTKDRLPSPYERIKKQCLMLRTLQLQELFGIRLLNQYSVTPEEYDRLMDCWEALVPYLRHPSVTARKELLTAILKAPGLEDCLLPNIPQ